MINKLRRLAFEVAAESLRESFDTYLMPQQCDLTVVIEGSDTCMEHHPPLLICCHYRIQAVGYLPFLACRLPPMASGDDGNLRDFTGLSALLMFILRELLSASRTTDG